MTAKQSKERNLYKVTACIDASKVNLVDKNGKSVVPPKALAGFLRLHRREGPAEVVRHQGEGDGDLLRTLPGPPSSLLVLAAYAVIAGADRASAEPVECPPVTYGIHRP